MRTKIATYCGPNRGEREWLSQSLIEFLTHSRVVGHELKKSSTFINYLPDFYYWKKKVKSTFVFFLNPAKTKGKHEKRALTKVDNVGQQDKCDSRERKRYIFVLDV